MVDSVRNSPNVGNLAVHDQKNLTCPVVNQVRLLRSDAAKADNSAVSVDLSISEKIGTLASSPPVNMEMVTEIRNKVEQGRYPIDLDAISAKLFESIQDGEG